MGKINLVALIGATASGKSELALEIAKQTGAQILSCDSLLVYRGLDIGTAKASLQEREKIPHHGIDIVEPNQSFTAGDYVRYVRPIIDSCVHQKKPLLIVGGTGFYLKALLLGTWNAPPTQPHIRKQLESQSPEALYHQLKQLDVEYAQKIKENDTYRVIRALEIIQSTGEKMTVLLKQTPLQNPLPYPVKIFGVKRQKMDLERRIMERTNDMFAKGIVPETEELLRKYPTIPRAFHCVGYAEVMQFLKGELSSLECRERIVISTRQLAKKQMTFFKSFLKPKALDLQWFTLPQEKEDLIKIIVKELTN